MTNSTIGELPTSRNDLTEHTTPQDPTLFCAFIVGLGYFTRIPCTHLTTYSPTALNRASYFLWLYGLLVGIFSAATLLIAHSLGLPLSLTVLLSMAVSILLTGAFHEDGLADTCDGFGGGWSKQSVLTIMKDSRLGTYGAVGLFLALSLKWQALVSVAEYNTLTASLVLVFSHAASRALLCLTMVGLPYVQEDLQSKAKPIAQAIPTQAVTINLATILVLAPILFGMVCLPVVGFLLLLQQISQRYFKLRLGGYTGDCLGAQQQILELSVYLLVSVVFK